jgi:hypothetical protein
VWVEQCSDTPKLKLGGPSNSWVKASFEGCESFLSSYCRPESVDVIEKPILFFTAGLDRFVLNEAHEDFLKKQQSMVRVVEFPNAYHELLFEADVYRNIALREISDYVKFVGSKKDIKNYKLERVVVEAKHSEGEDCEINLKMDRDEAAVKEGGVFMNLALSAVAMAGVAGFWFGRE